MREKKKTSFLSPFILSVVMIILIYFRMNFAFFPLLGVLFFIFLLRRDWALSMMMLTLFFEADPFSLFLGGVKVRVSQTISIIALIALVFVILIGKARIRKTPIDFALWSYVVINFIAVLGAVSSQRSIKISFLLLSLVLFFYVVIQLGNERNSFGTAFWFLLVGGFAEVCYGLYQVLAGILNGYFNIKFPIGYLGMVHAEVINSPWGRPYGTFVEPDWYGAICSFYALLFIGLYFSKNKEKRTFYFFGVLVSLLGLLFSFVRAAWIGFLVGLFFMAAFGHRVNSSRLRLRSYAKQLTLGISLILCLILISPAFFNIMKARIKTTGGTGLLKTNVRFIQMTNSFKAFLEHPILGSGPGSFTVNKLTSHFSLEKQYDPSLLTTVLEDTGILGFMIFILLIGKFFAFNLKMIPRLPEEYQVLDFSLTGGLLGLFVSYFYTHGFWIPFTWAFMGMTLCAIELGLKENDSRS
jgi:hypothetical protein